MGRRYLIGVAAAVQLAIFPVWMGAALVIGMPSNDVLYERLLSFAINLASIAAFGVAAYAALHLRAGTGWTHREATVPYITKTFSFSEFWRPTYAPR